MLTPKRIEEAQKNVQQYLQEGILFKIKIKDEKVIKIFISNAKESVKVAELLFTGNHSYLWTIVCSYYAMYYIANAVLYHFNYKVGEKISHKVTADGLIVYVRNKLTESLLEEYDQAQEDALQIIGIKVDELVESFDLERAKRSRIQYHTTEQAKEGKAKTSLERAKKFILEMEKLMA